MSVPFTGSLCALITPFQSGELDGHVAQRLETRECKKGAGALTPCTLAEFLQLLLTDRLNAQA